jgi:hypothetical protein
MRVWILPLEVQRQVINAVTAISGPTFILLGALKNDEKGAKRQMPQRESQSG